MASQGYNPYQHQQLKKQQPWIRDNHSLVAVNPEKIVTLMELAVEHYGRQCARCGAKKALTVHHRHYRHTGFEKAAEDIVLLCNPCHRDLHERSKEKRLTRDDIPFVDPQWADSLQGIVLYKARDAAHGRFAGIDPTLIRIWKIVYRDRDGQEWVSLDEYVAKDDAAQACAAVLAAYALAEVASFEDVTQLITAGDPDRAPRVIKLAPHQKYLDDHPKRQAG